MKLKSFKVGPYRNVINSGDVTVQETVTVLVGKNESGKTNLLQALHALRPARTDRNFPTTDYPRWLQKRHQLSGEYDTARPVTATFALEPDDVTAIKEAFGEGVLEDETFTVYRTYGSTKYEYDSPRCNSARAIRNADAGPPGLAAGVDLAEMRAKLTAAAASTEVGSDEPTNDARLSDQYLSALETAFGASDTVASLVAAALEERMPQFFYFDDLDQLPGTSDTAPLVQALRSGSTTELNGPQRTALALLKMGQANADIISTDYEPRKAELEAVGSDLTDEVLEYWKQNPHLSLRIDINPVEGNTPQGVQIIRRELKLDVFDERHRFTNSLDARSSGFRWFISFIAAFAEFEKDSKVIVLLDEPALSLHGRAQADFLRFIQDRVASRHQVLYTTHSPFMVEAGHLDRVRIVEDAGPKTGVQVSMAGGAASDPDSLFPLQAALGYDIAQNLFVGPDNLAVEGLSDFTYLTVLSEHLESLGRAGLNPRWRILPAGGATNIPTFVALVGPALDITVLADGAEAAGQKVQNLVRSGLLTAARLITPEAASPVKNAETEDLFNPADYLALYNAAFGTSIDVATLPGSDRIIKRIERAAGAEFDHNLPARHLLHNRMSIMQTMSDETLNRYESIFKVINSTLT